MNFPFSQYRYLNCLLKTTNNVSISNHQCKLSTLSNGRKSQKCLLKKPKNPVRLQFGDRRTFIPFVGDRKEGYRTQKEETFWQHTKFGFGHLKNEVKMWTEEWKDHIKSDILLLPPGRGNCCLVVVLSTFFFKQFYYNIMQFIAGEIDPLFEFGKPGVIEKFIVTSDSDHNEGNSRCSFTLNESGYGLFSGVIDSTVLKSGNIYRAGYCNITSLHHKVC